MSVVLKAEPVKAIPDASTGAQGQRSASRAVPPKAAGADCMRDWNAASMRAFTTVGFFSVFVSILMLTMPIYLFQLSDRVLTSRSLDTLLMLSIVALGLILVLSVLDVLRRQVLGRLATSMATILGGPVLASIVNAAPAGGGGNTLPLRSLHQVRGFIASPTMLLLFDVPLSPLYFGAIFLIHPQLGVIVLVAALLLAVIALLNEWYTARPLTEANAYTSKADTHAESLARNAQVLNAMGMLNESILHWGKEQAQALRNQVKGQERNYWITGLSKCARLVTQIFILGYGAYLALQGELTGGMMIAASIIAGRALQPLEGMIEGWRSVVQARQAYGRVKTAIAPFQKDKPRLQLPKPEGKLSLEKILYLPQGSKEPVLNGINFELAPGEHLAIVGPSGSGKSTLARIIVGCSFPTAGKVRLDGTELRNWDRRQFGEYSGYLPQEVELFPGTIRDNVCRMRNDLSDDEVFLASKTAGVHDMITSLLDGYETVLDRNGAPLSGGQKQRIALARAFFGEPSLVVLDEPNSNLDAVGEHALAETFKRAKEKRITIVVVTQRPALLNIVDKVLILRGGRMEAFGHPGEVLHRLVKSGQSQKAEAQAGRAVLPAVSAETSQTIIPRTLARNFSKAIMSAQYPSLTEWHRGVSHSSRWPSLFGFLILLVCGVGFSIWAALAPLEGAIVASGSFVATGHNKQIQHLEGGILREVLVKEGDRVEAGQPLLRMDDTTARAKLRRLSIRQYRLLISRGRLEAEIYEKDSIDLPAALIALKDDPEVSSVLTRQNLELKIRRLKLGSEQEVFRKEIAGLQESIQGYKAQVKSTQERVGLFKQELKDKNALFERQLVRKTDIFTLQRAEAGLAGELGELLGRIADSKERVARADQQIASLRSTSLQKAVEELRATETEIDDVQEQIGAASDVAERIEVRAPVRGIVVRLNHHTQGGVLSPGAVILELLPLNEELVIEARVSPSEIAHVREGQQALVRLSALNQRMTPMIAASVVYLSADTVAEQDTAGAPATRGPSKRDSFIVRVKLDATDLDRNANGFSAAPGMPADIFIKTAERTFFNYMMQPVFDSFARAFREE